MGNNIWTWSAYFTQISYIKSEKQIKTAIAIAPPTANKLA